MRFQKQTTPPPYLNRRDQYRMLGLVSLLMLIILGIQYTSDPKNWNWFFNLGQPQAELAGDLRELNLDDIDFRVVPNQTGKLPPETFIAQAELPTPEVDVPTQQLSQFPQEVLQGIEDQHVGLLRREQPALNALLEHVRNIPQEDLQQAADANVGFRVINVEPQSFRGALVQIDGLMRSFTRFPFGERTTTEDDLYQAWVFTSDSGAKPWMVLCVDPPANLTLAERMEVPVTVSGYFFKRYGYQTLEGMNVAPLLIAKTIHLKPTPQFAQQRTEDISLYVLGTLAVIALLFGLMIWWFIASDRKFAKSRLAEIAESRLDAAPEVVAELNNLPTLSQAEMFQQLQDNE